MPIAERECRAVLLKKVTASYGRIDEQVRVQQASARAAQRSEDERRSALSELNERHKKEQDAEKGALDPMEFMRRHAAMTSRQMAETGLFALRHVCT